MVKKQITDFIHLLQEALSCFVTATFSSPVASQEIRKVEIRPVLLREKRHFQISSFTKTQCFVKNVFEEVAVFTPLLTQFSQALIRFTDKEFHVQVQQDGNLTWKEKKSKSKTLPVLQHDRQKNYLLQEGEPIDFLIALGIMNKEGRVHRDKYDKFKQINRFLESILNVLPKDETEPLQIIDFGCGKAYLTFALYYVLRKRTVQIIGIDLKKEVLEKCQKLANELGYSGLQFISQPIAEFNPPHGSVDLVLALHACDIASDEAIAKACLMKAKAICIAPCCQHEIATQLKKEAFPVLLTHGLLHERFSALITDALRAEILKQLGYKTELLEFIDPEHTPKNLLIRAKLVSNSPSPDWTAYRKLTQELALTPKLEVLLRELISC